MKYSFIALNLVVITPLCMSSVHGQSSTTLPASAPAMMETAAPSNSETVVAPSAGPWGFDLSGMDRSVKPGDDFAEYATGGWMNPISHATINENTKVLLVALPDVPDSLSAINRIRTTYQIEFHQQLVGMTIQHGCGTF